MHPLQYHMFCQRVENINTGLCVQGFPLRVTPLGTAKTFIVSRVSLYPALLGIYENSFWGQKSVSKCVTVTGVALKRAGPD